VLNTPERSNTLQLQATGEVLNKERQMRKIITIIAAALLAAAGNAGAVIGDMPDQYIKRFAAKVAYVPPTASYPVGWLYVDNGHWFSFAFTLDGKVEGECYKAMSPASSTAENGMHLVDSLIAKYTGKGRYAKRWTKYMVQQGIGYSRSDGLLFIEAAWCNDGHLAVNVASLRGYRWLMSGGVIQQQQDEPPADQMRPPAQKLPELQKL
jgi:hypothetical protein